MASSPPVWRGLRSRAVGSALATLVLASGVVACSDDAPRDTRLLEGAGVEAFFDSEWHAIDAGERLPDGAEVRTNGSAARLAVAGEELWLGPDADAIIDGARVDLQRGEALAHSEGALRLRWADVELFGEGVYRLTPGVAARLRVYEGEADVRRPGEWRVLKALREVALIGRRLPASAPPLAYDHDDEWDRILLAGAIAFDNEADRLSAGIDQQFGTDPQPSSFYAAFTAIEAPLVPLLARTAAVNNGEGFGPPSDPLLTAFVAQAAPGGTALVDNLLRVAKLRGAGARWGLIATELGVSTARLTAAVDLGRRLPVAIADASSVPAGTSQPPVTSGAQPPAGEQPQPGENPPPGGGGAPDEPPEGPVPEPPNVPLPSNGDPPDEPPPDPIGQIIEALLEPLDPIVEGLDGVLR